MSGVEIPNWLKKLPLAPEFYPTETEFADPIAYISKIEKEASAFGICKVIPPLPKPSKKYTYSNLNKSLSKFPDLGSDLNSALASSSSGSSSGVKNGDAKAVFTTRHQELGYGSKRYKGSVRQAAIHKQVWQSGEVYTLEQFETKSKIFAKNQLGTVKDVTPLIVEALFWKTSSEKPIYVEYANDVPGSGFGEPDFPNRYFHKPQRKRKFSRNHRRNLSCEKREIDTEGTSSIGKDNENSMKIDFDPSFETCKSPSSASMLSDGCQRLSKSKSLDAGSDREGSAGWKLSNCPWNLQVIARSPGSLTRFMLEDIPGVTSPMIYIGMLYSWFAWHVEDHELHSLNYLHTGSPKTWYAVPGDRAVAFEEIVCSQGYGGNIDRLAALMLLGEKTNLLSPEVVVASGLSCCRLIQYPGEFVVTFPRAYHVGFSHGFNCGEAANFGTPQWLKVAKEAAVRRAAMDLLPMLSHQQLLYMLTVSFISRVPRALVLPGARSSRLRDRKKEERELVVKKAFIDDMVSESNLLLEFLGKQSTSYAVTWDPELLPSTIKDSQSSPSPSTFSESCLLVDGERDSDTRNLADENIVGSCENPVSRTELSLETGEGLYENENELPCGLHLDSGALVCVACGILGFPFMSIVQPSHCASEKLLRLADSQMVQEGQELLRSMRPLSPFVLDHTINKFSDTQDEENQEISSLKHNDHILIDTTYNGRNFGSVDVDRDTKGPPMHPDDKVDGKWSRVNGFLRPRIFCLEHGLEIKEMLHSKGGAEVLIICHSAYQKIKSHASAVSEEIGVSFNCKEVPLKCASQEDLKLINIAIDSEEHEEGGEDWTSGIGINLQHRVKLKKLFPSKQDNYALVLRGLFPEKTPNMDMSSLRWNSKKIRTPVMTTGLIHYKLCGKIQIKEVKQVEISARNKVISDSGPIQTKSGKNLQVKEDIPLDISGINKVTVATSPNLSELCENNHTKEDKAMVVSEGNSVNGKTNLRLFVSWDNSQTKEEKLVEILGMGSNIQAKSPRKFKLCDNTQIEEDQSMEVSDRSKVSQENTIILYSRRARNKKTGFPSQPSSSLNVLPRARTDAPKESFAANGTLDNNRIQSDDNLGGAGNTSIYGMELVRFPVMKNCKFKSRDCTTTETRDISEESDPSKFAGPLIAENVSIELSVAQSDVVSITEDNRCVCKAPDFKSPDKQGTDILANKSSEKPSENRNLEETDIEDKDCNYAVMDVSEMQQEGKTVAIESNQLMVMDVPETQHEGKASADESVVCNDAYLAVAEKGPACAVTKISEMQLEAETSSPKPMVCHQANTMTMEKGWEDVIMHSIEVLHEDKTATYESNQPISLVMRNPGMQQEGKAWAKESATCCQANPFCQPKISVLVNESSEVLQDIQVVEEAGVGGSVGEDMESKNTRPTAADPKPAKRERNKRSRELHQITKDQISFDGFTRGPCEGLRPRNSRTTAVYRTDSDFSVPEKVPKKLRKQAYNGVTHSGKNEIVKEAFACNIERCQMRFKTKTQLVLHKQNQCTHKGCGKTFSSHKKVILHQRVHAEERPLKCSWQGCNMSFKWAWARTEHLRLHTGERPYECKVSGCGLTFRFVSDYSRHRRKTGHYVNSP